MSQSQPRLINLSELPLSWLIGSVCIVICLIVTVTWNASAQTRDLGNKIDQLIVTSTKMEKRLDDRDRTNESLRDKVNDVDRVAENLKWRVDALERAKK